MMKFLVLLLLPLTSWANFDGKWDGTGKAVITNGKSRNCQEIYIRWKETTKELVLQEGGYICDDMHASFGTANFVRNGNALYYEGKKVGSLSTDRMFIGIDQPAEGIRYELTLVRKGGTLSYDEKWTEDGKLVFVVSGELKNIL